MMNLDSLKRNPKELFDFLGEELDKDDVLSQEVKSFFERNDVFELAESAIENNCSIYTVETVINKIEIIKEFKLESFQNFLKALYENNENYFPLFTKSLFSKIAKQYPEKAKLLIDSIKELNYQLVPDALAIMVIDNDNISPNQKYDYALLFIKSGIEKQYLAGYSIIEKCVLNDSFTRKNEAMSLLKNSLSSKDNSELVSVVRAACNLSLTENELQNEVFLIREKNNPSTNKVISSFLFLNSKAILESEFLKKLFLTFTNIPCEFKGIVRDLDFILMDLLRTDFDLFFNFITKWIDESDFKNNSISFCEIWSSFFSSLDFNKQVVFIYTTYFLKDEIEYHRVAADIIHNKGVMSEYIFNLDDEIIKKCDADDIIFLCRKILGHIYDIQKMCDLFNSLLRNKIQDKRIVKIVTDVIITLSDDYGFPVLEYVKKQINSEITDLAEIYKSILPSVEANAEKKNKLSYPELLATYEQKVTISRKKAEEYKEIAKKTESKSVFLKLVKHVKILYGKGFCFTTDNAPESKTSTFSKIEHSFYCSKRDFFCPVDSEMERFFFRIAKRGEK